MSGSVLDTVARSSLLLQGVYALFRARENHLFFLLNRRPILWKVFEPKDKKIKGKLSKGSISVLIKLCSSGLS